MQFIDLVINKMSLHGFTQLATPYLEQKLNLSGLFSKNTYLFTVSYQLGNVTYVVDSAIKPSRYDLVHFEQYGDYYVQRFSNLNTEITVLGVVVAIVIPQCNYPIPDNNNIDTWLMPSKSSSFIARASKSNPKRNIKAGDLLIIEREHQYIDGDLLVMVEDEKFICREIRMSTCELIDVDNNVTKIGHKLVVEGAITASIRVLREMRLSY